VRKGPDGARSIAMAKKKKAAKKAGKKKAAKKAPAKKKAKAKKKARRTTLYSSKGKKLYAVRDSGGKFKDIQTYQRAHSADIKRSSAAEEAAEAGQG
jgi:hypothetical protein